MLGNFPCICYRLLLCLKKELTNTISLRVSNGLDPDQDRHSVSPDLSPNCLQNCYQQMTIVVASKEIVRVMRCSNFCPFK